MKKLLFVLLIVPCLVFAQKQRLGGYPHTTFLHDSVTVSSAFVGPIVVTVAHDTTVGTLYLAVDNDTTNYVQVGSLTGYGENWSVEFRRARLLRFKGSTAAIPYKGYITPKMVVR